MRPPRSTQVKRFLASTWMLLLLIVAIMVIVLVGRYPIPPRSNSNNNNNSSTFSGANSDPSSGPTNNTTDGSFSGTTNTTSPSFTVTNQTNEGDLDVDDNSSDTHDDSDNLLGPTIEMPSMSPVTLQATEQPTETNDGLFDTVTETPSTSPVALPATDMPTETGIIDLGTEMPSLRLTTLPPTTIVVDEATTSPSRAFLSTMLPTFARPTGAPTDPPTSGATTVFVADTAALAKRAIEDLIREQDWLAPKFLRLGFQDCIGGCDGCVDLSNMDNAGLEIPIYALRSVVEDFEEEGVLSRADIWALAAMTGAEMSNQEAFLFPLESFGRVNCEDQGTDCLDQNATVVECSDTRGPHREIPSPDVTTHELLVFFEDTFGFDSRQTVAIMGAHTLGDANRKNSGFRGEDGWVSQNRVLDNEYYRGIVGGVDGSDDLEELYDAPNWRVEEVINEQFVNIPDRFQWVCGGRDDDRDDEHHSRGGNYLGGHNGPRNEKFMLNADIALVRDFGRYINGRGEVSCTFEYPKSKRCPHADETIRIAADFRSDNTRWLSEFRDALIAMLNNY